MWLKRLKTWLGWDAGSGLLDFGTREPDTSARPPISKPPRTRQPEPPKSQNAERAKTKRDPLDVLDNPRLTLDKPADDGFDPYNTGAFNRSASWERIGRQRKR